MDLVREHRNLIQQYNLEPNFFKLIEKAQVDSINGYIGNLIEDASKQCNVDKFNNSALLLRGICLAYESFQLDRLCCWGQQTLTKLCSGSDDSDKNRSDFAEFEAFGYLSAAFHDKKVEHIDEEQGKKGKTADFRIKDDLEIEVYCPDESHPERERVTDELEKQIEQTRVHGGLQPTVGAVVSRPVTGSKPNAIKYSTNQTIARVVGGKRDKDQFSTDKKNILWVDLKHKLALSVKKTQFLESINHQSQTSIGCFGIWHAFYGEVGKSIFPTERYQIKGYRGSEDIYYQHKYNGLFRERSHLSGAILSCLDGIVLFLNPWCDTPLTDEQIRCLTRMPQFCPEYSFFIKDTLKMEVTSKEAVISFLLEKEREKIE